MNEDYPLFSILVANYNSWPYTKDSFESFLNQDYKFLEIIVVDDFSDDQSIDYIHKLSKEYKFIKLFKNDTNRGVGYTKRKCIELATGSICGFVDPDDYLPNNFQKIRNLSSF